MLNFLQELSSINLKELAADIIALVDAISKLVELFRK